MITPPVIQQRHPTIHNPPVVPPLSPNPEQQARPPPHHVQQVTFSATFNGQPTTLQFPQQALPVNPAPAHLNSEQSQSAPDAQESTQGTATPPQPQVGPSPPVNPHFQAHINAVQAQAHALFTNQLAAMQQHPAFTGQLPMMGPHSPMTTIPQPFVQPQAQQGFSANGPVHVNQQTPMPAVPNFPHLVPQAAPTRQHTSRPHSPLTQGTTHTPEHRDQPHTEREAFVNQFRQFTPTHQQASHYTHPPLPASFPMATASGIGPSPHMPHVNSTTAFTASPSIDAAAAQLNASPRDTSRPESPALYLLSSPSGPQALLVSPSGMFSTPWFGPRPHPVVSTPSTVSRLGHHPDLATGRFAHGPPSAPAGSGSMPNLQHRRHPEAGQAQAPVHPGDPAHANPERRDVGRIAAQISTHIWMLVRLFGFIWFFSHGASTSRTIMLCLIGTLVFFGQIGMFQGLWQRVRRRADDILHGGHGQPNQVGANRGTSTNAAGPSSATPEQTADRLLAERRNQEGNAVRQVLRRCERAAMLFFGSLAPGLAERHIQARNDAESARQREVQEREDREKGEEEARKAAIAGTAESINGNTTSNVPTDDQRGETSAPLIEV